MDIPWKQNGAVQTDIYHHNDPTESSYLPARNEITECGKKNVMGFREENNPTGRYSVLLAWDIRHPHAFTVW